MKQYGFSLIECIIYCLIVTIITICTLQWALTTQSIRHARPDMALIKAVAAFDAMRRDCARIHFFKTDKIMNCGAYDLAFLVREGKVLRVSGQYNPQTGTWTQVTKNTILEDVHACTITPVSSSDQRVCAVEIALAAYAVSLQSTVATRIENNQMRS